MNDTKENKMVQLKIPLAKPWLDSDEAKAASDVVSSRWLIFGKQTEAFEEEFAKATGAKYAVAVNSGSSAILVSLIALGVKAGDEVIVPDLTFVSTASAALFMGAIPVFTDIELDTYCMDYTQIEKKITPKTKVIIPVHYAGQTAEMSSIIDLAKKYDLRVLEDAAESHLAQYKGHKCGTLGDMGIFSFTPSKPMTTGEGGMIVTNNSELAEKARLARNYGDTDKFQWDTLGFNFRMPEMMSAIGRIQLGKLKKAIEMRRNVAARYSEGLKGLEAVKLPYARTPLDHIFQLYTIRLNLSVLKLTRDDVIHHLAQKGVSTRLYYPALHHQKVFESFRDRNIGDYPNMSEFEKTALSLPIYPELTDIEVDYVVGSIKEIITKFKR